MSFVIKTNMSSELVKIYSKADFEYITRGIRVVQCTQDISDIPLLQENVINNLEDLAVSDSLCCSYCNTIFENKLQQRQHYKLDWHRYNLKQHLCGFKSVSRYDFELITSHDEKECNPKEYLKTNLDMQKSNNSSFCIRSLKYNIENDTEIDKVKISEWSSHSLANNNIKDFDKHTYNSVLPLTAQNSKIFFENQDGIIFSIYECLLHSKKDILENNNRVITRALECGKKTMWTIVMIGGGHFAGAVFSDGNPLVHKTLHYYTVRSKQGSSQKSKDNHNSSGNSKSAGSSMRRRNEAHLLNHVQSVLSSWSSYITDSSLILYRAVGPYNRSILFNGKNAPFDKHDPRLRKLPFPTNRPTYNEIKRVYEVLSTVEVHTHRSTSRRADLAIVGDSYEDASKVYNSNVRQAPRTLKYSKVQEIYSKKQNKNNYISIDRAKPRKSPSRPLPDIIEKLAQSSSESEGDIKNYELKMNNNKFTEPKIEADFQE